MSSKGGVWLNLVALLVGITFTVTYLALWVLIRAYGSLRLSFGPWGPPWVEWFEVWIEPLILVGMVGVLVWAFCRELRDI